MYKAPVDDYKFLFEHVIGLDALMRDIGNDDVSAELAEAVLDEAGKLAADVIAPLNHDGDIEGSKRLDDGQVITPKGFVEAQAAMRDGGWSSMEAKPEFGGQGLPMVLTTAVNEFWQAANMSFALCHLLTQGQIHALQKSAAPDLQQTYIPPMADGRWTGTMNLTEPQAGSDLAAIKSRAVPNGDHYLITGQKIYITYGEHDMAENIVHLVLARTPDAPAGIKGISVFIVPKFLPDEAGNFTVKNDVRCLSIEKKLGIKASPTAVMQFGETTGAVGYLVGAENQGIDIMFGMMNHARIAVGLQGLAIAERAYQQAVSYARGRVQGVPLDRQKGDPIIHHPDILRTLGSMKAEIEAMRAVMMTGAAAMDRAHHDSANTALDARVGMLIPIIKGWMTERGQIITSQAMQTHGGMGFIEETGAAQFLRDVRVTRIFEGDKPSFGSRDEFPFVATTYSITEMFRHWTKHARLNAIAQPEQFVEISEKLAAARGIVSGDEVKVSSKRGFIRGKAVVTKRVMTLQVAGQEVEQVGIPCHWGFEGTTRKGFLANTLSPRIGDANTHTPEYKAFLVNVEKV